MTSIQDDTNSLILVHYDECTENSDPITKSKRGVILDTDNKVVCQSFGYTQEYQVSQVDQWGPLVEGCIQNCHIYLSEEGSLLRLFFHEDVWHLSTHKRIDAFGSYWSSDRSFGDLFIDALEYYFTEGPGKGLLSYESRDHLFDVFCNTLDRESVFTFLLRTNKDTRIVCRPPEHPTVYFAGQFYHGMRLEGNPTLIEWPTRVHFPTVEGLRDFVSTLDPNDYQGVIVFMTNQTVFKVMVPNYLELAKIRGCEPSFYRAYLRLRDDNTKIQSALTLFPEKRETMKNIETDIVKLATRLAYFYAKRYIHKEHVVVNKHYYYLMRTAHGWHCECRERNIVSVNKFLELIDLQTSQFIGILLAQRE